MSTLNPGIVGTVRWLNFLGFVTTDSGDGKTHDFECDRDYAYVVIVVPKEHLIREAERLVSELARIGIRVLPMTKDGNEVSVQATYDPAEGTATIDLSGVCDETIRKSENPS